MKKQPEITLSKADETFESAKSTYREVRRKRKSCELKNSNWTLETKVGRVVYLLIKLLFKIILTLRKKLHVSERIKMNYFVSVFTCILSTSLCGMQKVAHSETLMPGGKSVITSYLHILPQDVEELVAQLLIHAHPALFSPISCVL